MVYYATITYTYGRPQHITKTDMQELLQAIATATAKAKHSVYGINITTAYEMTDTDTSDRYKVIQDREVYYVIHLDEAGNEIPDTMHEAHGMMQVTRYLQHVSAHRLCEEIVDRITAQG